MAVRITKGTALPAHPANGVKYRAAGQEGGVFIGVKQFHWRPAPWYHLAKAHLIGHFLDRAVLANQLAYGPSQGKPGGVFLKPAAL